MKLSNEAVTSFQEIYLKKCGIKLDYEEAEVMALEDLKKFSLIYRKVLSKDKDLLNSLRSNKLFKML